MSKNNNELICKYCGSDNVVKKKQAGYATLLSILLLGLPLPLFKKSYYCFDCEKEWKDNKTR